MPLTLDTDAYSKIVAPLIVTLAFAAAATPFEARLVDTSNWYA